VETAAFTSERSMTYLMGIVSFMILFAIGAGAAFFIVIGP
jgi:hypothetical protein